MAKTQKPVNRQRLAEAIASAEAEGPLANRQTLYASVAERYNATYGPEQSSLWITPSIVLLRIAEWQMTIKTPVGRRGRPVGSKIPQKLDEHGHPIPRKRRKASAENMQAMRQGEFSNPTFDGLLAKIESGSLTARIKANCLACAGFVREEVKHCGVTSCPLWDVRPFRSQSPNGLESDATIETNEILDVQPALAYALPIVTL